MSNKKELWLRLKHYHFDDLVPAHMMDHVSAMFSGTDASTKAFASKLSRKLHWSPKFALRAIDEYKKFVYLGNAGTMSVTPSKFIDCVWHEHLLFSKAYRVFCRDVVGQDFDHNPELVPLEKQTDVFEAQYLATLDAYAAEFHMEPPADIWDVAKFKRPMPKSADRRTVKRSAPDRWSDDTPLYQYFDGGSGAGSGTNEATPEFGGAGGFSGAGAGRSWGSDGDDSHSHSDSTSHSHGNDSSASDSGGGDSGGSSCSSSCGGGSD